MKCKACEGGVDTLSLDDAEESLKQTPGWEIDSSKMQISRTYSFANFYETMAFVNALAWVAHVEDHHPDFEVGYKTCKIHYFTHAIRGLSVNDYLRGQTQQTDRRIVYFHGVTERGCTQFLSEI